jgi:hypothetical protein
MAKRKTSRLPLLHENLFSMEHKISRFAGDTLVHQILYRENATLIAWAPILLSREELGGQILFSSDVYGRNLWGSHQILMRFRMVAAHG